MTGAVVAATLLLLEDDDVLGPLARPFPRDEIEQAVRIVVPAINVLLGYAPWRATRALGLLAERIASPGFIAHYVLRKHLVRTAILEALRDGFRQVVLLGAGFDMLGHTLPETARVFELDLPAARRAKRDAMLREPVAKTTYLEADFSQESLRQVLDACSEFDPRSATVFVAEGLVMYLACDRVMTLLGDIAHFPAPTRSVFSVITPDARGDMRLHSQRRIVDRVMRFLEEPFVWGIDEPSMSKTFAASDLIVDEIRSTSDLRSEHFAGLPKNRLPRDTGERIIFASNQLASKKACPKATAANQSARAISLAQDV